MRLKFHMKLWSGNVQQSMKMVFVTSIIRHKVCIIYLFLDFFIQKSFLTNNYFLIAEIDLVCGVHCILVLMFIFT